MIIKHGLPPVIHRSTTILILGSLPSDESIRLQQYYANPGNDFWKLISVTIREDIISLVYSDRIDKLISNGIGLWDVFHYGERDGSMDSNITNEAINDFSQLPNIAPSLQLICFNGKKAGQNRQLFQSKGYRTKILLSSSGANRRYSTKRAKQWRDIAL